MQRRQVPNASTGRALRAAFIVTVVLSSSCKANVAYVYVTRESDGLGAHLDARDDDDIVPAEARAVYCVANVSAGETTEFVGAVHRLEEPAKEGDDRVDRVLANQSFSVPKGSANELLVMPFLPMDEQGIPSDTRPFDAGLYECEFHVEGHSSRSGTAKFLVGAAQCPDGRITPGALCFVSGRCNQYGPASNAPEQCTCDEGAWNCAVATPPP